MTVNDFINELQNLDPALKKKDISVLCPNGLMVEPKVRFSQNNPLDFLDLSSKNIDSIIISDS